MHVAQAQKETHICPFDQVEKISRSHFTEGGVGRDKCLHPVTGLERNGTTQNRTRAGQGEEKCMC
jgi:hypothetical protein